MIPYGDFLYFGILLYVVVPTVALGLLGRAWWPWTLVATAAMLVVQYAPQQAVLPGIVVRELWLVLAWTVWQWAVARAFLAARSRTAHRGVFAAALGAALLPLLVAKYVPHVVPELHVGFLGISYVTLRSLDAIICIQDRLITALPPLRFAGFLLFFATISSGPIDRYRRFAQDSARRRTRAEFLADCDAAVHRIATGFLYKFIVAALIARYWLEPAAARPGVLGAWSYMYAYTLHLFFDFAGYSAFAIGVGRLFGIRTPENFDRPFLARNIRDFWNRWHISLSWWLRDHVYMRFVMAAMKGRWFANAHVASAVGLFLAFGLMGLWHGAARHYVLYGLYHGALLAGYEAFSRWNARRAWWGDGRLWQAAGVVLTFHCVCLGFLLFSGRLTGDPGAGTLGPQRVEGQLEVVRCREIAGWAWDAATPDVAIDVDILADGHHLATVRADLHRPDLAAAGKGDGAHAFVFVPPLWMRDGVVRTITATVARTGAVLDGSAQRLVCGRHPVSMDGRNGMLEHAGCGGISGWAGDAAQPDTPLALELWADDVHLATTTAVLPRPDRTGVGRGFHFPLPEALADGVPHVVTVRIAGSNLVLRHSPQVVQCDRAAWAAAPTPTVATADAGATPVPIAYVARRDGTIASSAGLVWERKVRLDGVPDAANLHDADNCYPWYGRCTGSGADCQRDSDCEGQGTCAAADCQSPAPDGLTVFEWLDRLRAARFAGHDDWRLPTARELHELVTPFEHGEPGARAALVGAACGPACTAVEDPACSCTPNALYWAAPGRGAEGPDESWMTYFYCMGNLFLDLRNNRFHVRAVRDDH